MENTALCNVDEIADMFPDVPRAAIVSDLEMTFNSEETINRILDGQLSSEANGAKSMAQHMLGSDEELPDLEVFKSKKELSAKDCTQGTLNVKKTNSETTFSTKSAQKKFSVQKTYPAKMHNAFSSEEQSSKFSQISSKKTTVTLHDISDNSDSDDDRMFKPGLIERLTQSQRTANLKSFHNDLLSDSSDLDDIPSYGNSGRNTKTTELDECLNARKMLPSTAVNNNNKSLSQTSSQCSTVLKDASQYSEYSGHSGSQISTEESQVLPGGKCKKGKKRTPEGIEESKKHALQLKEETKRKKEEEKLKRLQEREQKKREQDYEKQKKRNLLEARKQAKPGECLKFMTAILSPGILRESSGAAILDTIQKAGIKYDIQQQVHDNIITMWREVSEVKEVQPMKLETITTEKVEDCILLLLPISKFVSLVHTYKQKQHGLTNEEDLHEHIVKIKNSLEGRDVTVIVQGLEKYFRDLKTKENRAFKNQVQSVDGEVPEHKKKKKKKDDIVAISRLDIEESLVHLQLMDGCNIRFADQDAEVAKMVQQYVKAVAEKPFKRDRLQTGFTFHLDSAGSANVDREGNGLAKVWRLQLQQFPLVTAEVANTIIAEYPSPLSLCQAYQSCDSVKQAERLIENLEVRRGAGVMATTRRVGKELSRRLYQFFTSSDPDFVIL